MASLLARSPIPVWAVILLMTIGAVIFAILVLFLFKWLLLRRRWGTHVPPSPSLAPMRRMTLRRGRLVPASRYASLTGSLFGLGNFAALDDHSATGGLKARSRSPFALWVAAMYGRPQSSMSVQDHVEDVTETRLMDEPLKDPEPAFGRRHGHQPSAASSYSLPSIINGRELAEDAARDKSPEMSAVRSDSSYAIPNFSRSLTPLRHTSRPFHPSPLSSTPNPYFLPEITEASPRHSATSGGGDPADDGIPGSARLSASSMYTTSHHHSIRTSDPHLDDRIQRTSVEYPSTPLASSATDAAYPSHAVDFSVFFSQPNLMNSSNPFLSAHSLVADDSRTPPTSYMPSHQTSDFQMPALPVRQDPTPKSKYRSFLPRQMQRQHLATLAPPPSRPIRQPSKKGNVLRKKSFIPVEIVSNPRPGDNFI